jgi:hypothetical protein
MSKERERLEKVLAIAINPGAIEYEAIAALKRARDLVKQNPSLAHPPASSAPPLQQHTPQGHAAFRTRITTVHPNWLLILVELLSKRAYDLELKYQISFDFKKLPTAVHVVYEGSRGACHAFDNTVEWAVDYINQQLTKPKKD